MSGSMKKLAAVAHDVGHHAQSALSWLHPHLGEAALAERRSVVSLDLAAPEPYPEAVAEYEPLRLALRGLREKYQEILAGYDLSASDVHSALLEFEFPLAQDLHSCRVGVLLRAANGKQYRAQLDLPGELRVPTA